MQLSHVEMSGAFHRRGAQQQQLLVGWGKRPMSSGLSIPRIQQLPLTLAPWRQWAAEGSAEGDASIGSGWMDMPEVQAPAEQVEVFPRLKEKDPYKLLGVSREASFEEVQEARNFLYEQYRSHDASRESIELALDAILQEKMKARHKHGFRPPQRGKKGEAEGEMKVSLWQQFKQLFEPSVPVTTLVNDGSIFLALGLWAAWQAASSDPTLPIGGAICFCAWKLYDKRLKRNPDGPHWGGSPIWGALLTTIAILIVSALISFPITNFMPLPRILTPEGLMLMLIAWSLGLGCMFIR